MIGLGTADKSLKSFPSRSGMFSLGKYPQMIVAGNGRLIRKAIMGRSVSRVIGDESVSSLTPRATEW